MNVKLKIARHKQGLRQFQLASLLEISENKLSQFETGRQEPTIAQKVKLAEILNVKVEDIF